MKCKVISQLKGYFTSAYLFLEGQTIQMAYDGDNLYKSTDIIDVKDNNIDIVLRVNGLNGTAWTLELNISNYEDSTYKKEYSENGKIEKNQTSLLNTTVKL
jgi:hypothetical protein